MLRIVLLFTLSLFSVNIFAAKKSLAQNNSKSLSIFDREIHFLELRIKKDINDKKNSLLKKYTLTILAAREFKSIGQIEKSKEFFKKANDYKIDIDKQEIKQNLKNESTEYKTYFFESNIKELIAKHAYEKAILAINPESLSNKENESLRIIYDLLQVKIKNHSVKKLYCLDSINKDLEGMNYESVICDYLNEYLKDGKKDKSHLAYLEEYFFKNDLNERYLLSIVRDL